MNAAFESRSLPQLLFRARYEMGLVCFADESGTHDPTGQQKGSEVCGVAGYLFPEELGPILEDRWQQTLRSFGVTAFHMREFNARGREAQDPNWPYFGWTQEKKDAFIKALASLMRIAIATGAMIHVDDYDRVLSRKIKAFYQHPYHLAFQLFLAKICNQLDDFAGTIFPGQDVAFFFDQQDQFSQVASKTFCQLKRYQDPNGRLGSITFVSSRQYILLQAADLLAARLRKIEARARAGGKMITEGGWDEVLLPTDRTFVGYFGQDELKGIQTLCDAAKWHKPDGSKLTSF
jgi:hypothetical protein